MLPFSMQNKLLAHKIAVDDFELDAPVDVGHDVVMLRKSLDIAAQAFFRCEAGNDSDPGSLQARLASFLHTAQSQRDENPNRQDGIYGANLTINIKAAKGFSNSIFVMLTFGIDCGDDTLLFLYTQEDGQWQQRLHWYSDKYTKPSDAFGNFFLYTSVPGADGTQLVAVAHGHPWCTSRFSFFDVDLLRPATSQSPQNIVAHTNDSYSRGDTTPTLKPSPDGVTLRLDSSSRDLEGVFTYIGVFSYKTKSNTLERMPVANNARDFVDSWLDESWSVADRWSAQPSQDLHLVHDRFDYSTGSKDKNVPNIIYGPVRACSDANKFQVEMVLDETKQSSPRLYAQVRQNVGSFTMLAITPQPHPSCTGPDLMVKHTKH
jgi:hypothetical protein